MKKKHKKINLTKKLNKQIKKKMKKIKKALKKTQVGDIKQIKIDQPSFETGQVKQSNPENETKKRKVKLERRLTELKSEGQVYDEAMNEYYGRL